MKKLFMNELGKVSFTKIGAWLIALSQAFSQPGLLPVGQYTGLQNVLGVVTAIGAALAAVGVRDAISKKQ